MNIESRIEQMAREVVQGNKRTPTYTECVQLPKSKEEKGETKKQQICNRKAASQEQIVTVKSKKLKGTEQQSIENV